MSAELFVFDRARLHLVTEADATGYVGGLALPAQACRAVFLAAEVEAIRWDDARWPELEFGIWCDEPELEVPQRRRRAVETMTVTQLSTWLQLRPTWPQLGGPGISWPRPDVAVGPEGYAQRLEAVVVAAIEALNAVYRRTVRMGEVLVNLTQQPTSGTNGHHKIDLDSLSTAEFPVAPPPSAPLLAAPQPATPPGSTLRPAPVFAGTVVAHTERDIADALATLTRQAAEWAATISPDAALRHVDHAITPLTRTSGNGHGDRFLVSLTATTNRG